ncbi:MAG: phosphatase PAP2 family protein [Ruminococcaceae bacterium]|nr:phosphatase PAP2 family protein [Oscillospiraceae bacterium]MBQ9912624.1 phosphatase PAP2 family protein [Clostridia bacterium]
MDAIFNSFLGFDLSVFEWVQSIQSSFLSALMVIITTLGDEGIIFIAMGLVLLLTKKYRKVGFTVLVSLVVMLIINNLVLKEILERVRPFYVFNLDGLLADKQAFIDAGRLGKFEVMVEKIKAMTEQNPEMAAEWMSTYHYPGLVDKLTSFSFPSGHTSSAFAAAIAVLWYNRKIGIPVTFFAAVMGFSRIYVQVHYCTDVIGAAVVGIIYALIGVLIAKYLFPIVDNLMDKVFSRFQKKKDA